MVRSKQVEPQEAALSYSSRETNRRPIYRPMEFFVGVTWSIAATLLFVGIAGLIYPNSYKPTAALILALAVMLVFFLISITRLIIGNGARRYTFELKDDEVRLRTDDHKHQRQYTQRMPLKEVTNVEWLSHQEASVLVFHGKNNSIIEVPVWSMTDDVAPIINHLKSRGISVVKG